LNIGSGFGYLLSLFCDRCVRADVLAALRVKPDVHGPHVHDLDFLKLKVGVTLKVFLDDLVKVIVIEFDLALDKAFVLVIFDWIDFAHWIARFLSVTENPHLPQIASQLLVEPQKIRVVGLRKAVQV
jgi:hypothetical protein